MQVTLGVIGLGLIGGSLALDLKHRGYAGRVLGVENNPGNAETALRIGLVDQVVSLEECERQADIIIVAVPVGTAVKLIPAILDQIGPQQLVIDVCSTKSQICHAVKYHPKRQQFVSTHPMAGTEYSGPEAAQKGLFDGRACIFADTEESAPQAVAAIEKMYGVLNMRPTFMNADQHDVHTAYVSHISHVTSFALALTVLEKEKDEKHIFDLASGGFASTVRLAKSNADMWVPILIQNRDNMLQVMDTYMKEIQQFRDAIATFDEARLRELITEANKIKRILK